MNLPHILSIHDGFMHSVPRDREMKYKEKKCEKGKKVDADRRHATVRGEPMKDGENQAPVKNRMTTIEFEH